MGEAGPSDWTEELERTGQVEFPLRNVRGLVQLGFVAAIGLQGYFGSARDMLTDGGWVVFGVAYWGGLIATAVWLIWKLTTGHPVITVDKMGIRSNGKPRLLWTDISSTGPATGPKPMQRLEIISKDIWAKPFTITQDNVKDLPALATWLNEVLEQHRAELQT
jgi:hypothetical protein